MVNCCVCHQTQCCLAEPLPENNILVHCSRLQLLLLTKVKDLERPGLGLQRNNILGPVHDSTIGLDRSSNDIATVLEFDDYDFRGGGSSLLFADAYEGIGFEGLEYGISSALNEWHAQFEKLTQELNPIDACYNCRCQYKIDTRSCLVAQSAESPEPDRLTSTPTVELVNWRKISVAF